MRRMSAARVAGTLESEEQTVLDVTDGKTHFQFANSVNRDKSRKCFGIISPALSWHQVLFFYYLLIHSTL